LSDKRLVNELTALPALFRRAATGTLYLRFAHEIVDSTANCHTMSNATYCELEVWTFVPMLMLMVLLFAGLRMLTMRSDKRTRWTLWWPAPWNESH
jgi:hypothetical protein